MPNFTNDPVVSVSNSTSKPAVQGEGSANEGVKGISHNAHGGVVGINDWSPSAPSGAGGNGGWFESTQGEGVRGWAKTPFHGGVVGVNTAGGFGVYGQSDDGVGVVGESKNNEGVRGVSHSARGGVVGINDLSPPNRPGAGGNGGWFESAQGEGVRGTANNPHHGGVVGVNTTAGGIGVFGTSDAGVGVWGTSRDSEGVHAETRSLSTAAIAAFNLNPEGTGAAIFGKKEGNRGHAGFFDGDVWVSRELTVGKDIILANADCAEDFTIADAELIDPGTVMVVGEEGVLHQSHQAYDKRVVGVISGAGDFKPAIVLDKQKALTGRKPVALLGKVFCKVDASQVSVGVGDLLTTSDIPGHAMKAVDPAKAFGTVIGKALRPLKEGQGLIPILVALQ
jgi:hypothetical protein